MSGFNIISEIEMVVQSEAAVFVAGIFFVLAGNIL